jgi:O-antigen/teichoic acid export membrane protein
MFVAERVQRLAGAAKKLPVPEGTWSVGAGLIVVGLSAYGFQILAAKKLSVPDYNALNVLWAMVFVLTPGLFQPLEQEVGRAVAARRVRGEGGAPLVKRAAFLGFVLAVAVIVIGSVFHKRIIDKQFDGRSILLVALFAGIIFYYAAFISRGALSGNGRFGPYGLMHGSEGTVRILACVVLFAVGTHSVGPWAFALVTPPLIAVAVSLSRQRGLMTPGPEAPYSELSGALAWLLVGSVLAQLLSYASVFGVNRLAHTQHEKDLAAAFITGLFVARVPLLLFQAVQAALLPKLAGLASEGKHDDFRVGMKRLVMVVLVLCSAGVVASTLVGPFFGAKLFATKWDLGHRDMFLLTLAATSFILALTLAQGLIALKAYIPNAFGWIVGIVMFVVVDFLGNDLILRNELAFLAGGVSAAIWMAAFLVPRMLRGGATLEDLVQVVEHETLEI